MQHDFAVAIHREFDRPGSSFKASRIDLGMVTWPLLVSVVDITSSRYYPVRFMVILAARDG